MSPHAECLKARARLQRSKQIAPTTCFCRVQLSDDSLESAEPISAPRKGLRMRHLLAAAIVGLAFVAWIWLGISAEYSEYKWAEAVKRELQTDGFTITREQRVGDLALPWTWIHAPIKMVGFQRFLDKNVEGLIYGIDGYLRLDSKDKTEHAAWLRKIDCPGRRFAYLSLKDTGEIFENFEQIERALDQVEWISQMSVEVNPNWQREWFDRVIADYCP